VDAERSVSSGVVVCARRIEQRCAIFPTPRAIRRASRGFEKLLLDLREDQVRENNVRQMKSRRDRVPDKAVSWIANRALPGATKWLARITLAH
jgi:hypothetical protein